MYIDAFWNQLHPFSHLASLLAILRTCPPAQLAACGTAEEEQAPPCRLFIDRQNKMEEIVNSFRVIRTFFVIGLRVSFAMAAVHWRLC